MLDRLQYFTVDFHFSLFVIPEIMKVMHRTIAIDINIEPHITREVWIIRPEDMWTLTPAFRTWTVNT